MKFLKMSSVSVNLCGILVPGVLASDWEGLRQYSKYDDGKVKRFHDLAPLSKYTYEFYEHKKDDNEFQHHQGAIKRDILEDNSCRLYFQKLQANKGNHPCKPIEKRRVQIQCYSDVFSENQRTKKVYFEDNSWKKIEQPATSPNKNNVRAECEFLYNKLSKVLTGRLHNVSNAFKNCFKWEYKGEIAQTGAHNTLVCQGTISFVINPTNRWNQKDYLEHRISWKGAFRNGKAVLPQSADGINQNHIKFDKKKHQRIISLLGGAQKCIFKKLKEFNKQGGLAFTWSNPEEDINTSTTQEPAIVGESDKTDRASYMKKFYDTLLRHIEMTKDAYKSRTQSPKPDDSDVWEGESSGIGSGSWETRGSTTCNKPKFIPTPEQQAKFENADFLAKRFMEMVSRTQCTPDSNRRHDAPDKMSPEDDNIIYLE